MNQYETMVLIAPTLGPDAIDRLLGNYEGVLEELGGNVTNINKWGRRQLAYEIQDYKEGIYAIYDFEAPGESIKEFERRLRLNDSVLRFLTTKNERKNRLIKKGAAVRAARQEKNKNRPPRPERSERGERGDRGDRGERGERHGGRQ